MGKKTLCWTCINAYANKCPYHSQWHTPVPGWTIERSFVMVDNGPNNKTLEEVPCVIKCPLYRLDPREDIPRDQPKRETKRERQARFKRNMFAAAAKHKQTWEEHLKEAEALMH